jgi:hypothetical protein
MESMSQTQEYPIEASQTQEYSIDDVFPGLFVDDFTPPPAPKASALDEMMASAKDSQNKKYVQTVLETRQNKHNVKCVTGKARMPQIKECTTIYVKNKKGKNVLKSMSDLGKRSPWPRAVLAARQILEIRGFVAVRKGTELHALAKILCGAPITVNCILGGWAAL